MTEIYRQGDQISKRKVGETLYLIDTRRNTIHQLNPIGAAVWDQLSRPESIDGLVDMLHVAFADTSRRVIKRDVENLIGELLKMELIIQC